MSTNGPKGSVPAATSTQPPPTSMIGMLVSDVASWSNRDFDAGLTGDEDDARLASGGPCERCRSAARSTTRPTKIGLGDSSRHGLDDAPGRRVGQHAMTPAIRR